MIRLHAAVVLLVALMTTIFWASVFVKLYKASWAALSLGGFISPYIPAAVSPGRSVRQAFPRACARTCPRVCVYTHSRFLLKSSTELKFKLPACYFHETSVIFFSVASNPFYVSAALVLCLFLFSIFAVNSHPTAMWGETTLWFTLWPASLPHHPFPLTSAILRKMLSVFPASPPPPPPLPLLPPLATVQGCSVASCKMTAREQKGNRLRW